MAAILAAWLTGTPAEASTPAELRTKLDACTAELTKAEKSLADRVELAAKQVKLLEQAKRDANNYSPENIAGRLEQLKKDGETEKARELQNRSDWAQTELKNAPARVDAANRSVSEGKIIVAEGKARCAKIKRDLEAAVKQAQQQKEAEEKKRLAAEREQERKAAALKAEQERLKNCPTPAQIRAFEIQHLERQEAALTKDTKDALYELRATQGAIAMMNKFNLKSTAERNEALNKLIKAANTLNSDPVQTVLDASMDGFSGTLKDMSTAGVTGLIGWKVFDHISKATEYENLIHKGDTEYIDTRALSFLSSIGLQNVAQHALGRLESWKGEDKSKPGALLHEQTIGLNGLMNRLRKLRKELQALKAAPLPAPKKSEACEKQGDDAKDISEQDESLEEEEEISESIDDPVSEARPVTGSGAGPVSGSSDYRGNVPGNQSVSGSGNGTSDAMWVPEGGVDIRIQHNTDNQTAYMVVHIEVDTNDDGAFCSTGDAACQMVHQAAYGDLMAMDATIHHDWYFYGGQVRFRVDAPGDWQISVAAQPRPRHRLQGRIEEQLVKDGIVYDMNTASNGATVTATSDRGEVFTRQTDGGAYEMMVWGDTGYTINVSKPGYASASEKVPAQRFQSLENRAISVKVNGTLPLAQ